MEDKTETMCRLLDQIRYYDQLLNVYQTFLIDQGASPKVMKKFQEVACKRAKL